MLNSTTPYRRDENATLRVPVVMPLVEVTVDDRGHLDVRLDREPYSPDGALHRNDLKSTLESIANDLGTPLRVEVHETDGSAFTDIVTPTRPSERPAPPKGPARKQSEQPFLPDEEVSVAVVVARRRGDAGDAPRLPPALLAAHRGDVVLVGRTSGAIRVLGE